jgi:Tubulin/FtsZ family, GTPase domain
MTEGTGRRETERNPSWAESAAAAADGSYPSSLRLGQELRVVLVAVGGGAVRIGREIARQHLRHVETVAINCDPKVQGYDEYDRRVYLGPGTGEEIDTGGSPVVGGVLARAAEPSLQGVFHGASFVVLIGSLGGGAGSGALPHLLELASRHAAVVSAFVIKPFRCEGERRALAERAIGRLRLVEAFAEKRERGCATLEVLDNEKLVPAFGDRAFRAVGEHWAAVIGEHVEQAILAPAEALLASVSAEAFERELVPAIVAADGLAFPGRYPPAPPSGPELPPVLPAVGRGAMAELTFEVESDRPEPPTP